MKLPSSRQPGRTALGGPGLRRQEAAALAANELLTAFLDAAVVGLFADTIAQFTALAVTMRGLVLREIMRQWKAALGKEAVNGPANGLAVAATAGLAVYVWSRSLPLFGVIVPAMVISMLAAGRAGALVRKLLRRLGQDRATASPIILTTITDVVGFFSFLGNAALFAPLLAAVAC